MSKTPLPLLSTGSTQEDPSRHNWNCWLGHKESNQTKSLCILYPLTKFEAPSHNHFWDICIIWIASFQWPNLQRAITWKNKIFFSKNLFNQVIYSSSSFHLTEFEAPSYIHFWNSLITSFQCPNFQRAVTKGSKWNNFFVYFHQVIYSSSSISWLNLSCNSFGDIFITSFHRPNLPIC